MPTSIVTNEDNMAMMSRYPDKYFDLAIVDPPYGIGATKAQGTTKKRPKKWLGGEWDENPPEEKYFKQLFRVSKNQIIWGANYFNTFLENGNKWIIWDKVMREDQSHCELAWTSFKGAERVFTYSRSNLQGFRNPNRFHPTEKPISLYEWLLNNFANLGNKILDTHLGSGSSRIAAHNLGFDFYATELDEFYFDAQEKRFAKHIAQTKLFTPQQLVTEQTKLL